VNEEEGKVKRAPLPPGCTGALQVRKKRSSHPLHFGEALFLLCLQGKKKRESSLWERGGKKTLFCSDGQQLIISTCHCKGGGTFSELISLSKKGRREEKEKR